MGLCPRTPLKSCMPSATARQFQRVARQLGFERRRQTGSHERRLHPGVRSVTIPPHGGRANRAAAVSQDPPSARDQRAAVSAASIGDRADIEKPGSGVQITIRQGTFRDLPFLREMLFEAAFWRPGVARPAIDEGLSRPELAKLLEGWGRRGDAFVIAEDAGNRPVGAAWYRFWSDHDHSYGYVSADIPELGIAVVNGLRERGIGGQLLYALRKLAADRGIASLSLSVEEDNPARRLYLQHGFEQVATVGNAWTMVAGTNV